MEIYLLSFLAAAGGGGGEAIKQIGSPLFFLLETFFGVPLSPHWRREEEEERRKGGTGVTQSRVQSLLPSEGKERRE